MLSLSRSSPVFPCRHVIVSMTAGSIFFETFGTIWKLWFWEKLSCHELFKLLTAISFRFLFTSLWHYWSDNITRKSVALRVFQSWLRRIGWLSLQQTFSKKFPIKYKFVGWGFGGITDDFFSCLIMFLFCLSFCFYGSPQTLAKEVFYSRKVLENHELKTQQNNNSSRAFWHVGQIMMF